MELSDILVTPPNDAAVIKKWTKGITGARDLTSDDYVKMLDEAERKKKEIEKEKQRKKEEMSPFWSLLLCSVLICGPLIGQSVIST